MHHRFLSLLALLVPLGLSSCIFGPSNNPDIFPYGRPRYGHGGTQSPPPPPPIAQQRGSVDEGQQYEWQGVGADPRRTGASPSTSGRSVASSGGRNSRAASTRQSSPPPPPPPAPAPAPSPRTGSSGGGSQQVASTASEEVKYGTPVPGRDGMLYSPYKPDAGLIDITTRNADGTTSVLPPGTKIKDPFTGKPILVP